MPSRTEPASRPVAATQAPDGAQQVTIDATNMFRFSPAVVTAHVGKVQVTLVDTGSYPHNVAVDGLDFTSKTVTGDLGQNTTTFTLSFTKPGRYPFRCTFHSSAGMRGAFVIR